MPWQVVAGYAAKALGSYFGGKAKQEAAQKKAALQREEIQLGRDWALTDLSLESRSQGSRRESEIGSTGARGSSGSFQEIRGDEARKSMQRRTRILAGSELELKKVAQGLRSEVKAAQIESTYGQVSAIAGYYGDTYEPPTS